MAFRVLCALSTVCLVVFANGFVFPPHPLVTTCTPTTGRCQTRWLKAPRGGGTNDGTLASTAAPRSTNMDTDASNYSAEAAAAAAALAGAGIDLDDDDQEAAYPAPTHLIGADASARQNPPEKNRTVVVLQYGDAANPSRELEGGGTLPVYSFGNNRTLFARFVQYKMGLDTTVDEAELSEREVDLADEDEQQNFRELWKSGRVLAMSKDPFDGELNRDL